MTVALLTYSVYKETGGLCTKNKVYCKLFFEFSADTSEHTVELHLNNNGLLTKLTHDGVKKDFELMVAVGLC